MDRRNRPRHNRAGAPSGSAAHGVREVPLNSGWDCTTTKRGEILIWVSGDVATGYSLVDGSEIAGIGSAELLNLAAKGAPCPNGSKRLDEARRAATLVIA